MTIQLEFTAQLRRAAGVKTATVELSQGATLQSLLSAVRDQFGPEFRRQLLTTAGALQPTLLVFRGDSQVPAGSDPSLVDGETVTLMSPISGG